MKIIKLKQKRQHKRHEKQELQKQIAKEIFQEEILRGTKVLSPVTESTGKLF